MLIEFFAVWGLWFWMLVIAEFGFLIWFVDEEWYGRSFTSIIIFIIIIHVFGDAHWLIVLKDHPKLIIPAVICYIIAGLVWAGVKFRFVLSDMKHGFKDEKVKWLKRQDVKSSEEANIAWKKHIKENYTGYKEPDFMSFKSKIIGWMAYWPISLFWTFLSDFLRRIWSRIFRAFSKVYESMFKSTLKEMISDFEEEPIPDDKGTPPSQN